ncbi:MAG: hypothetical protein WBY44_30890 [Bryobacteraceae bacterium]
MTPKFWGDPETPVLARNADIGVCFCEAEICPPPKRESQGFKIIFKLLFPNHITPIFNPSANPKFGYPSVNLELEGLSHARRASGSPFIFGTNRRNEMSTAAQIAANQQNAQRSTGPISEAGRKIVASNAVKHHFTSKGNPALPGEEDAVEKHVEGYFQTYVPVGIPEKDLVRNLAENNWRLTRVLSLERSLLVRLETAQDDAFVETLKELRRTSTYAHRIQHAIEKSRAELKSLQSDRKSKYAQAQEEAVLLTQLAHLKGEPVDQAKEFPSPELYGGFVYSLPEIARVIGRAARLAEAKTHFQSVA